MTKQVLRHRDNPMECGNAKIRLRVESKGWKWYKPGKIASFVGRFCFPRQFSGQFWSTFDFLKVFFCQFPSVLGLFQGFSVHFDELLASSTLPWLFRGKFWLFSTILDHFWALSRFSCQFWSVFAFFQGFVVDFQAFLGFFTRFLPVICPPMQISGLVSHFRTFFCHFWIFPAILCKSHRQPNFRWSTQAFLCPPHPLRTFVKSIKKFPRWKIETNRRAKRKFFLRGVAGKFCNLKQLWKKKF